MAIHYVAGTPVVEHGDDGRVLVHFLTDTDAVTLVYRSDENYQLLADEQQCAYKASWEQQSRAAWPSLWAGTPETAA